MDLSQADLMELAEQRKALASSQLIDVPPPDDFFKTETIKRLSIMHTNQIFQDVIPQNPSIISRDILTSDISMYCAEDEQGNPLYGEDVSAENMFLYVGRNVNNVILDNLQMRIENIMDNEHFIVDEKDAAIIKTDSTTLKVRLVDLGLKNFSDLYYVEFNIKDYQSETGARRDLLERYLGNGYKGEDKEGFSEKLQNVMSFLESSGFNSVEIKVLKPDRLYLQAVFNIYKGLEKYEQKTSVEVRNGKNIARATQIRSYDDVVCVDANLGCRYFLSHSLMFGARKLDDKVISFLPHMEPLERYS